MFAKQSFVIFDVLIVGLVASVAISAWSVSRSMSLLAPLTSSTTPTIVPVPAEPAADIISVEMVQAQNTANYNQELSKVIADFVKAEPNDYGIVVKHLASGEVVSSNANDIFISASLYKPFVAIEALKLVDKGELSLDRRLAAAGGRTVKECIKDTISVSDNDCGHALLSVTNSRSADRLASLRTDGYAKTDLRGDYPTTSAQDVAHLFEQLYAGKLLSKNSNKLLLGALKNQQVADRLPTGLPDEADPAHKTGDLEGVVHDAGIIYSEEAGDYIIAILSGADDSGRNLSQRYARFGELTESIHQLMLKHASALNAAPESA